MGENTNSRREKIRFLFNLNLFYNEQINTNRKLVNHSFFMVSNKALPYEAFVILYFVTITYCWQYISFYLCTVNLALEGQKMYKIMSSYFNLNLSRNDYQI